MLTNMHRPVVKYRITLDKELYCTITCYYMFIVKGLSKISVPILGYPKYITGFGIVVVINVSFVL